MGLEPLKHEPTSPPCELSTISPSSPSTCHKAQWETARLEAEARLLRESLIYYPLSSPYCDSDPYLKLWNSEVGESFRKVKTEKDAEKSTCQSPFSLASCSTKCGSVSGVTVDACQASKEDLKSNTGVLKGRSVSSCKNEIKNSSESDLQLLLDFPGNNDLTLWEYDASCSTKRGSVSGVTVDTCQVSKEDLKSNSRVITGRSVSSCENEIENSSESSLQLLLDFPGNNDLAMWEYDASCSTKCGSVSGATIDACRAFKEDLKSNTGVIKGRSVSSCKKEIENSSESALQLLFDFPGNNDLTLWEYDANDYF